MTKAQPSTLRSNTTDTTPHPPGRPFGLTLNFKEGFQGGTLTVDQAKTILSHLPWERVTKTEPDGRGGTMSHEVLQARYVEEGRSLQEALTRVAITVLGENGVLKPYYSTSTLEKDGKFIKIIEPHEPAAWKQLIGEQNITDHTKTSVLPDSTQALGQEGGKGMGGGG